MSSVPSSPPCTILFALRICFCLILTSCCNYLLRGDRDRFKHTRYHYKFPSCSKTNRVELIHSLTSRTKKKRNCNNLRYIFFRLSTEWQAVSFENNLSSYRDRCNLQKCRFKRTNILSPAEIPSFMRRDLPTMYPSEETLRPERERERMGWGESEEDVEFRFIIENMCWKVCLKRLDFEQKW